MKIIFMGTPDYASEILKTIIKQDNMEVVAVFTQEDKPVGRKKVLRAPIVKEVALENSIKVIQPRRLRDESSSVLNIECDYIVVAAYGQILPLDILVHAPCINLHASSLPQYRGASPIQQSLLNDDKKTGVTAMLMEEGLDTGDILKISEIEIEKDTIVGELFNDLTSVACDLTIDILNNFKTFTPRKQDDTLSSLCKKIKKENGLINFDDAKDIYNRYRAYTPWPGIYLESKMKIKQMFLYEENSLNNAGEILKIEKEFIIVGCKKGSLKITKLQPPSKKEMRAIDYINGKRIEVSDILL